MRHQRTRRPGKRCNRRHSQLILWPDMPGAGIGQHRCARPEGALQLVRGQRLDGRGPGQQKRRKRDQRAAACNAVNHPGAEGGKDQDQRKLGCNLEHPRLVASGRGGGKR